MSEQSYGGRQFIMHESVDAGERWLCAMWDDGEVIHAAINSHHAVLATIHAVAHAQHGIAFIQLCTVDCPG